MNNSNYVTPATLNTLIPGYSTTEKATGRTWLDGKTIFQRTFTGNITRVGGQRDSIGLIGGVQDLIDVSGFWLGSDGVKNPVPQTHGNDAGTVWYHFSFVRLYASGLVEFWTRSDGARSNAPYAVTLWYTKT